MIQRWMAAALLLAASAASQQATAQSFAGVYGKVTTPLNVAVQDGLRAGKTMESLAELLNGLFKMPRTIQLVSAECGEPNAFYMHSRSAVVMCLELFEDIYQRTERDFAHRSQSEREQMATSAFVFVLFHELGHAFVQQLELPVLGREEDAADQISAFMVLQANDRKLIGGALWFFKQRDVKYTHRHFSGQHSLHPQRQANLACLAYGKNSSLYAGVLKAGLLTQERAEGCAKEYSRLSTTVRGLLRDTFRVPTSD